MVWWVAFPVRTGDGFERLVGGVQFTEASSLTMLSDS